MPFFHGLIEFSILPSFLRVFCMILYRKKKLSIIRNQLSCALIYVVCCLLPEPTGRLHDHFRIASKSRAYLRVCLSVVNGFMLSEWLKVVLRNYQFRFLISVTTCELGWYGNAMYVYAVVVFVVVSLLKMHANNNDQQENNKPKCQMRWGRQQKTKRPKEPKKGKGSQAIWGIVQNAAPTLPPLHAIYCI